MTRNIYIYKYLTEINYLKNKINIFKLSKAKFTLKKKNYETFDKCTKCVLN